MPRRVRKPLLPSPPESGSAVQSPEASPEARPPPAQYSCLLCKQRKVRCDRKSPCSVCVRRGAECVPTPRAPYTSRKRRRAPSDVETPEPRTAGTPPRPPPVASVPIPAARAAPLREQQQCCGPDVQRTKAPAFGQNLWTGLHEEFREPLAVETPAAEEQPAPAAGTTPSTSLSAFAFGHSSVSDIDLKSAHPQAVHAFVLWQAYLQGVNPLSKVIYAPQVQDLVVQAAGGYDSLSAPNVALLFAIYAAAVSSLPEDECQAKLGEPKKPLLEKYLACTQQALAAAGFLRATSLVLLQAFTIFLLAAQQTYDPYSRWILTGMAVRMGQRLLASAPNAANGTAFFDTQMRLRVWWQIMLIDGRVAQLCGQTFMFIGDLPNHPLPANLNDSDISPTMTNAPPILDRPTEMLSCLLRYELGKFLITNSKTLYDTTTPMEQRDAAIDEAAALFQEKYLKFIDPAIVLHQIAKAGARAAIDKMRLMVHHPSQYPDKGKSMPQAEHDMLFQTSVSMVGLLVQGFDATHLAHFKWHIDVYFQLDAVVFMLIESQSQPPDSALVDKAWELVAAVLRHKRHLVQEKDELGRAVRQLVLRAWEARDRQARKLRIPVICTPPDAVAELLAEARQRRTRQTNGGGEPEAQAQADITAQTDAPSQINGGSAAESTAIPAFAGALSGLDPTLELLYMTNTTPSKQDEAPFSSYTGMDVLGWEPADWDSWDYWNTLFQNQTS